MSLPAPGIDIQEEGKTAQELVAEATGQLILRVSLRRIMLSPA